MTLPLIHALTLLHGDRRRQLAEILNNFNDGMWDELMGLLETSDSITYAESLMLTHLERAVHDLTNFHPQWQNHSSCKWLKTFTNDMLEVK